MQPGIETADTVHTLTWLDLSYALSLPVQHRPHTTFLRPFLSRVAAYIFLHTLHYWLSLWNAYHLPLLDFLSAFDVFDHSVFLNRLRRTFVCLIYCLGWLIPIHLIGMSSFMLALRRSLLSVTETLLCTFMLSPLLNTCLYTGTAI